MKVNKSFELYCALRRYFNVFVPKRFNVRFPLVFKYFSLKYKDALTFKFDDVYYFGLLLVAEMPAFNYDLFSIYVDDLKKCSITDYDFYLVQIFDYINNEIINFVEGI